MALPTNTQIDGAVPIAGTPNRALVNTLLKDIVSASFSNTALITALGDTDVKTAITSIPAIADKPSSSAVTQAINTAVSDKVTSTTMNAAIAALGLSGKHYDISKAPGVTTGVLADSAARQANGVALQTALDYCISNNLLATAGPVRLEYEATGVQNSRNVGLQIKKNSLGLIGAGYNSGLGTRFVQYAVNHPALTIGDISTDDAAAIAGAKFTGFVAGHGVSQTGQTQADGILLGRIYYSILDQFGINSFLGGNNYPPYVGLRIGFGNTVFFSNTMPQCQIPSGQLHYILWTAGGTGNAIGSMYAGSGGIGNRVALTSTPVFFNASGSEIGSIQQLNIEWADSSDGYGGLRVDNGVGLNIDVLHFEGIKLNGFSPALMAFVSSRAKIGTVRSLDTWIASANASGTPHFVHFYDSSQVKIDQFNAQWGGGAEKVASMPFGMYGDDTSLVGRRPFLEVSHIVMGGFTGTFNLDNILTASNSGNINRILKYTYDTSLPRTEGGSITLPSGIGTNTIYGVHKNCQIKLDSALTAARKTILSINLTSSGTGSNIPRNIGDQVQLYRTGSATGAFDWTIRDSSDTTTLATLSSTNLQITLTWNGSSWV